MSKLHLDDSLRWLKRTEAARNPDMTDRELLHRYLLNGDETAFEAIVLRHGRRVYAVCRQVLGDNADAEDAFQATFLVLLDKVRSIQWQDSLEYWLSAVAHRIAVRARARRHRSFHRENVANASAKTTSYDELLWREACGILHEELDRLPDKFRLPLLLCYLEGQSRDEAAQRLGWSLGAVKAGLERGRARLRRRLLRRGVTLSAGLLAALGDSTLRAGPPSALLVAAFRSMAGKPAPGAAILANGAVGMKALGKAKLAFGLFLAAGICVGFHAATQPIGADPPANPSGLPQPKLNPAPQAHQVPVKRFRLTDGDAVAVEFSPDGSVLAAYTYYNPYPKASPSQFLALYDAITGEKIGSRGVTGQGINSRPFAFSPDGKLLAIVDLTQPPNIICCDPSTGKSTRVLALPQPGPVGPVLLRFSPNGKFLAVAVTCNRVLVLDPASGKHVQELGDGPDTIFSMEFAPDSGTLALGTCGYSFLQLWNVATGKRLPGVEQQRVIASLAFSKDGKTLAAGRADQCVVLCDAATGQQRSRLEGKMGVVNGLAFLPDGNRLATSSGEGKMSIWDLNTRSIRWTFDGAAAGRSLAASPNGRAVALGTERGVIVWNLPNAQSGPSPKATILSPEELDDCWSELGKGALEAHRAMRTMCASTDATVSFLGRHLRPVALPDASTVGRLGKLLNQLDSESFSQRESATRALEKVGLPSEPMIRQAFAAKPSLETKRRLERILSNFEKKSLRDWRAVKMLEYIGTPPARHILEQLAQGADSRFTREAGAALKRLNKITGSTP